MLQKLRLERFRNFTEAEYGLGKKTVVSGDNGSGKTSLLEAIRLLSIGKSLHGVSFSEAVMFERDSFRLSATIQQDGKETEVELFFGSPFPGAQVNERHLAVNGNRTEWLDFIGTLPTVLFLPSDLDIVLGAPERRRRYLDGVLFQIDKQFRYDYLELQKVLRERSALLFSIKIGRAGRDELGPWNELLVRLTGTVREKRSELTTFIGEWLTEKHKIIPGSFGLKYDFSDEDIAALQEQEIKASQNLFGPHRDEVIFYFNDRPARRFSSRGQARLLVLALKAAEADFVASSLGREPLVLLDDLFSELDEKNGQAALGLFNPGFQVILTKVEQTALKGYDLINLNNPSRNA
ncbi:hypothetical protein A3A71_00480 [Candidatus Berkelbacteria bacterium RIFCSPLOWO2_01_FULL_50_28]|uniref:DNA replication and repair protein RecF n=1 Tax=Candidatus Berkelbacteria bacterium RIFCSPLOWO2_01_FULL_50_28 TaxID=1797471 RepID=A0A1F5EB06_9BACT|nr:MAG: hypothetical protein A2807_01230 [Candidatus Berkelbacteria bacterium RIFCSPHIGHO2_01_FULL_50_36]OGD62339.1 MAG: hypothetical protein A3F39_02670 [Candidatus Berkelbacteria bacterium RIFCSPHIGHO2_12_FULL_50_11]OGD64521.1 MAG: hypothetical protein A3A71_00480 [Candidatus Berkelbacteria bacterium RIFCSPLOWO2_01_FULL_50_28]